MLRQSPCVINVRPTLFISEDGRCVFVTEQDAHFKVLLPLTVIHLQNQLFPRTREPFAITGVLVQTRSAGYHDIFAVRQPAEHCSTLVRIHTRFAHLRSLYSKIHFTSPYLGYDNARCYAYTLQPRSS